MGGAPRWFAESLAEIGVSLDAETTEQLGAYLARLLATNEVMNLTSITDLDQAWRKHVLDALTIVPLLGGLARGAEVADVGSGGGVPGIPLAIVRRDLGFVLVEATRKKATFLEAVAAELGLSNVRVVAKRAESLASTKPAFDAVTARAVANLEVLVGWTAPLVRRGGRLFLIKGQRADAELLSAKKALTRFHCTHERTVATPTGRVVVLRVG
jgi:16S rRNA (guanine527-N7)-methyltransferase